jgi:hypothetical protein
MYTLGTGLQVKLEGQELRLQGFTERDDHVRPLTFVVHGWLKVCVWQELVR